MAQNSEANHEEDISINKDETAAADVGEAEVIEAREGVPAEGGEDPDGDGLQQELEAARRQARENEDKMLRTQAEMENLRKRTARDVENAHKFALEKFVNELLPVLDSLELGLDAANSASDTDSLREGMELTLKKFRDVLEKFGVTVIDPQGEKFNPERHEAMSMQELEGAESNTVVSVMQKGYELNGRLVRPAMVIVAK
ncbi:MAG: nucleotide exchange factor GrpE [Gammaproteobacteria bacterium]